jgi:hypothetical protein
MSQRTVEEILEDLTSLWYAWPTAPRELFDELQEELEQAAAQSVPEQAPRPPETRRGRTPKKHRRPASR